MRARQSAAARGYDAHWRRARARYLQAHPLCVMCRAAGRYTAATVVDHIRPHQGDRARFWDRANWQPLCKGCHDRHKRRIEHGSAELGCDAAGVPLAAGHHWRARGPS